MTRSNILVRCYTTGILIYIYLQMLPLNYVFHFLRIICVGLDDGGLSDVPFYHSWMNILPETRP